MRSRRARRQELLSAYLDERLGPGERAEAERLLEQSEDARRELESLRATVALVRQAPVARPRRSFVLTPEMVAVERPRQAGGWRRVAVPVAAATAVLFLGFSLAGGAADLFSREGAPSVAEQAPLQAAEAPATTERFQPGAAEQREAAAFAAPGPALPAPTPAPESVAVAADDLTVEAGPMGVPGPAGEKGLAGVEAKKRRFPWLALQLAAGSLTGLAIVAVLWQYRWSRSRRAGVG
ncbi:MAG: hypothetical protein V3V35_05060 [Dehalococcoidia bacterium]